MNEKQKNFFDNEYGNVYKGMFNKLIFFIIFLLVLLFICGVIVCTRSKPIQQNPDISQTAKATTNSLIAALQQANEYLAAMGETISDIAKSNSAAEKQLIDAASKLGEIASLYKSIETENSKLVENNKAAEKILIEARSTVRQTNIYNQEISVLIKQAIMRNESIIQAATAGTQE